MALFSSDNNQDSEDEQSEAAAQEAVDVDNADNTQEDDRWIDNTRTDVLVRPYITEKSTYQTDDGVYTFVVKEDANKPQIKQAIRDVYNVSVRKVRTAKLPKKQVESRAGKTGSKGGGKKAFVYLKEGDSIELM